MGNQPGKIDQKDTEAKEIMQFLKERQSANSSISTQISSFSVEKKWQLEILQTLSELGKQPKWQQLSKDIVQIVKSLDQDMFIKAVTTLNKISGMQLNQFKLVKNVKTSSSEDLNVSKYVTIQENRIAEIEFGENSPSKVLQKKSIEIIRQQVGYIIRKQLNQEYHPMFQIKESFMMIFQMKFRTMLDEKPCKDAKQKAPLLELMFQDIDFFCQLVVKGCAIYKPWVMKKTGIKEAKYTTFAKKMVVESLFSKHSMHQKIFPFLLQLNSDYIKNICSKIPQHVKVENFHIQRELQIEGHYVGSMMMFSEIDSFTSPRKTLEQLNKIKINICNDIENYHQTFKTGETYSIDGDNMLSIICFILCKLKVKLLSIYSQLELLFVAYGDNLTSIFESASYMVSAITAAFDYMASPDFKQ